MWAEFEGFHGWIIPKKVVILHRTGFASSRETVMRNQADRLAPIALLFTIVILAMALIQKYLPGIYFASLYSPYLIVASAMLLLIAVACRVKKITTSVRLGLVVFFVLVGVAYMGVQYQSDNGVVPPPEHPGDLLGTFPPPCAELFYLTLKTQRH